MKKSAINTLLLHGGEVPVMFAGSVNTPQIRGGKLQLLAVTGESRMPIFPDTPTIGEF